MAQENYDGRGGYRRIPVDSASWSKQVPNRQTYASIDYLQYFPLLPNPVGSPSMYSNPTTYIKDQDMTKIGMPRPDILKQLG